MEFFLSNSEYTLPYRIYGQGSQALLAFHGFGRSREDFRIFETELGGVFTIYSFDLPYHQQAHVSPDAKNPAFTMETIHDLLSILCRERNIDRFSVMGYSLGGKIALGCLEVMGDRIDHAILLAPDGLKINPFYFIGTRTLLGSFLFKSIIHHPGLLLKTGNLLEKLKLLNPKINHFVKHHMDTVPKRRRVFQVWMLYRKFIPDLKQIAQHVNRQHIQLFLFFGHYDSVIPVRLSDNLIRFLQNKEVLHIIRHGHKLLEKHEEISVTLLKNIHP